MVKQFLTEAEQNKEMLTIVSSRFSRAYMIAFVLTVLVITGCSDSNDTVSAYQGQEKREIKSLSVNEINGYLSGEGLGYAKTAELNHYPGPKHVLDLAKELNLTLEQENLTKDLFNEMNKQARVLGGKFIEKETELEQAFSNESINPNFLSLALATIAKIQSKIRYTHLKAHLEQKTILTQQQITLYDGLRGYNGAKHDHSH